MITRRLSVSITATIDELAKSSVRAAQWTPHNGKFSDVFGINNVFESAPDHRVTTTMLQNAILHKITVLEQKNEFPVTIGVDIPLIPKDEVTKDGQAYAITCFPQSHSTQETMVFCADADSTESAQWRSEFPMYNSSNLETQGVLHVNNAAYVFVHENHPVIQVLRINRELINADIDQQTKIDNEWFKVMRTVLNTCCCELRQRVLNKVSARDLNQFSVQISRAGGEWQSNSGNREADKEYLKAVPDQVFVDAQLNSENKGGDLLAQHIQAVMSRPYTYSARLEVQFEVHA